MLIVVNILVQFRRFVCMIKRFLRKIVSVLEAYVECDRFVVFVRVLCVSFMPVPKLASRAILTLLQTIGKKSIASLGRFYRDLFKIR